MSPHDLPFGYDPDISSGDVAFFELEAISNVYYTNFDFEWDEQLFENAALTDPQEEEDWESEYPPATPYVPTPEVVAWVDDLIREMIDRANILAFGTAEPRDEHYDEFFRQAEKGRPHYVHVKYRHEDDEDDD